MIFFLNNQFEIISIEEINGYTSSWKFKILEIITLGYLYDTAPMQYACVVTPKHVSTKAL
ncbi:MAG: hypothetical protein COX81_03015 [Candidatus Magasanikbacteria bacterium CG_4_10_14_0_2_um_filter_37_12]|uniref:Uncharacterized protein n=1 Tax=Candidatus Magasanikbacteria bacterium CG_4_10_14_0_2_um_filter_37_12 TaxID=1974637 RepID=A0A2M7V7F9_9BACT|nr:MAG: hypothetical protein COX81_03015 [Candidatus Magasanikbacteria bacterium CG_4_10_14_0_2_um_filter_37_12]